MTDEEKRAAETAQAEAQAAEQAAAKEADEAAKKAAIEAAEAEQAAKDTEIVKLKEERDNYKNVALKRLGKLPGDAEFMAGGADEKTGLTVEEQVRMALLEREIASKEQAREAELKKLATENAELKLALKSRPDGAIASGSGSNSNVSVKDPVFTDEQIADLRARATRLNADPEKFIENARKNFLSRG